MLREAFAALGLPVLFTGSGYLAYKKVAEKRGDAVEKSDLYIASLNAVALSTHLTIDLYHLLMPRIVESTVDDAKFNFFNNAIRQLWRQYGAADARFYLDAYQPTILTQMYSLAIVGGLTTSLSLYALYNDKKWYRTIQNVTATWQLGLVYNFVMPEAVEGFVHVKNHAFFWAFVLCILTGPAITFYQEYQRFSKPNKSK